MTPEINVCATADLTCRAVAARLVSHLAGLQAAGASPGGTVHVAATGGRFGGGMWAYAAEDAAGGVYDATDVDWSGVHVWFSDERFVADGDPERNDGPLLAVAGRLGLPRSNIHSAPGPDGASSVEAAAELYAAELMDFTSAIDAAAGPADTTRQSRRQIGASSRDCMGCVAEDGPVGDTTSPNSCEDGENCPSLSGCAPWFAVEILGIGEDGHVASLFPGRPSPDGVTFAVTDSPKPPPLRVSFTRAMLGRCDELWLLAAGAGKADAVRLALSGGDVPAAGLRGRRATRWFIDQELADALAVG